MGQTHSSDDPGSSEADSTVIVMERLLAKMERYLIVMERQIAEHLQDYLKSTEYSAYEKAEKMLATYVFNLWYTPDTSELKLYLQAISADVRFELLKKQYVLGYTALHTAALRGDTEMMRCLLEMVEPQKRYELLKTQDELSGETPLHAAAFRGRTKVMRCMLEFVEPENQIQLLDIPNKSNWTALDVAEGEETVQLIRQYRESDEREIAVERKLRLLKAAIDFLEAKIFIQQLRAIASGHVKVVSAVAPDNQSSSLSIQQESDKMGPREYLSYVHNDLSLEERESLMSDERQRSKSFLVSWPHDGNWSGVKMAQAGFYCVDDYDRAQCAFCRGSLHKWKAEDNPMTEHDKLFPFCRFVRGLECGNKEYKNDLLLAGELKNITPLTMPEMKKNRDGSVSTNSNAFGISTNKAAAIKYAPYETGKNTYGRWPAANVIRPEPRGEADGLQPGRIDTADSGPPPASCKTCYKKTSQVVQASQVGLPCGYLINCDKRIHDEKLKTDGSNGNKTRCPAPQCSDGMETDSPSIPPGSIINPYKAGLHGYPQTTNLVPDNLNWIFNPSLHGISSDVPPPPSYLTDVLCYACGQSPDNLNPLLPMALQQKLGESSPQEFLNTVLLELSDIQRDWWMSQETQRRKTFLVNWPHTDNLSGKKMAQAGLYRTDGYDRVKCAFCRGTLYKWEVDDDSMTEHARLFPLCRFVQGLDCGNKECTVDQPTDALPAPIQVTQPAEGAAAATAM